MENMYRKTTLTLAVKWMKIGDCPKWAFHKVIQCNDGFIVMTKEGNMLAEPGDWIAQDAEGNVYPIADSVFQKSYIPATHVPNNQTWIKRDGTYLVWNPKGSMPTVKHFTEDQALAEAKRLAKKHPGVKFYVMAAISEVVMPDLIVNGFKGGE